MHELIDEEGLGNMNLKRFLLPNAVSVWHSENTKWLSLPQYPRQPAATWSTSNCAVQFQSACFWCRGPRCSISADWKYLTENQESVAIGRYRAVMFLLLEVSPSLAALESSDPFDHLDATRLWTLEPGPSAELGNTYVFCYVSIGRAAKHAAMFNKIRSVRLKRCNQRQRFCISWLTIGDGVSCFGKGHDDSITAPGRCGHA